MGKNDQFANIAANGINTANKGLLAPEPVHFVQKDLPVNRCSNQEFPFHKQMNNKEELYEELNKLRNKYKPFLQRLAPPVERTRNITELTEFDWRVGTIQDKSDFTRVLNGQGKWEPVKIPHYGGPLGKAETYYRTIFKLDALPSDNRALFVCFGGVDYKSHVFLNGCYLGSHEGFFAPFSFECTACAKAGENILVVHVENDFVHKRNADSLNGEMLGGDKIYAATGPGYDDPEMGWHHCPPGMGIYQPVTLEEKPRSFIYDIFVRPKPDENIAEIWTEVYKCDAGYEDIKLQISIYGRNFSQTVIQNLVYEPETGCEIGLGDTFTEAQLQASDKIGKPVHMYLEKGINYFTIPVAMSNFRYWTLEQPWLYEVQVCLVCTNGDLIDSREQSFGMRSFIMDTQSKPKGMMYLNGKKIRLRGANTMGFEQQDVMNNDNNQLIDDILLAKICNMNFLRLTQRPVQEKVYEYCDMLGLMTQTDLPLFGVLRRNQFVEAIRQTEEMEKIVRKHPCNIMITYINEPFPNASNQPHRHLTRDGLMAFFDAADSVVHLNNPDRVIKHVDGDYDPPSRTLPDNHCYTCWYNGHGVDAGALHKGFWIPVNKDWYYGCGEFGAEGLESVETMRKYYPENWLPQLNEEESIWSPGKIIGSQSGNFHYFFYETPDTLEEWVSSSQEHQKWATKWMTEAFRRNADMVSFAIHLFIDAFPAGWMKTIMDVDRNPKPAYFAYRNALEPTMVSLRNDRFCYFAGEKATVEVWICNDKPDAIKDAVLVYEIVSEGIQIFSGRQTVNLPGCDVLYGGNITFELPENLKGMIKVNCGILESDGKPLHYNTVELQVYPNKDGYDYGDICILGNRGLAVDICSEFGLNTINFNEADETITFIVDEILSYQNIKKQVDQFVERGARLIFLEVAPGTYDLCGEKITVKECGMLPMHFVSRNTDHPLVKGFDSKDFRNWYDAKYDRITPILESTFTAEGAIPILTSGNTNACGEWNKALAAGSWTFGNGKVTVCQIKLAGRLKENPAAWEFGSRLMEGI